MISEKYISELLYHHECVIIPGFGGFVGNYSPSRIHPVQHTFYPPFKSLLFNVNLNRNDGLLANHIAGREGISFLEALRKIGATVDSWKQKMNSGNTVVLEGIGKIWQDKEGHIQFEQNPEINYLEDAFGLSPFVSPAIRRIGLQKKVEKRITKYIDSSAGYRRSVPKVLKWAAIMALPVGLAAYMGFTNYDRIREATQTYAGFVFSKPVPAFSRTYTPKAVKPAVIPHIQHPAPSLQIPDVETVNSEGKYSIIVGAFQIKENADNLVTRLKSQGFGAFIIDVTRGGLHRVCLQSYSDRNQALDQLSAIRGKEFASAWLLEK